MYIKVAQWLRDQVQSGALIPGQRIPTEVQLCSLFGIARGTVRRATAVLEQECLVQVRRGHGTYVCTPPPAGISLAAGDQAITTGAATVLRASGGVECYPDGALILVEA